MPLITADLRLRERPRSVGVIRNQSDKVLQRPAIVLGASAQVLAGDLAPGDHGQRRHAPRTEPVRDHPDVRADRGPVFYDANATFDSEAQRKIVRRAIIDQLTYDPMTGMSNAVLGRHRDAPRLGRQTPSCRWRSRARRPTASATSSTRSRSALTISGKTVFRADLMRTSVVEVDATFFSRDPWVDQLRPGQRPDRPTGPSRSTARFTAEKVVVGMNFGGDLGLPGLDPVAARAGAAVPGRRAARQPGEFDGLPEVELRDRHDRRVRALPAPGSQGQVYSAEATRRAGSTRRPARSRCASRTSGPTGSASSSASSSRATSSDRHRRRRTGLVKRYDRTLAVGGPRPRRRPRARSSASSARTAPARRPRCASSRRSSSPTPATPRSPACRVRRNPNDVRRVLGFMPDMFGVYDDMKVWEYLDFFARCYGIPADRSAGG